MTKIDFTKEQLFDSYSEFKSVAGVANHFDVSRSTIIQQFKKHGLQYDSPNRKFRCNHHFFSEDNELSFYWAGFLAANGNVTTKNGKKRANRISFVLAAKDDIHLIKFKNNIESEAPVRYLDVNSNSYTSHTVRFLVSSAQMVEDLYKRFGIGPQKTYTYIMPDRLLKSKLIHHFLRGWVDGKGGVYHKEQHFFRTSGTIGFLHQFLNKLIENSIPSTEIKQDSNGAKELGYIIYTHKSDIESITNYLYHDAKHFLVRKRNIALGLND